MHFVPQYCTLLINMTYLGKEYKFVKEENYDKFVESWAITPEKTKAFQNFKPIQKIELNGDTYTLTKTDSEITKELTFKSGAEFDEKAGDVIARTTVTVDGNTVTQVSKFPDGKILTFKGEYSGDDLVITLTNSKWDGVAKRYYKA